MLRYKEIKLQLKAMIDHIPANEKLPSRTALCKELDTTRSTLAKAMKELQDEGLIVAREGSGTYVSSIFESEEKLAGNWGLIVPNIMDAIYPGLVRGVENIAQTYGINVTLCNSDNDADKQEQYIKRLMLSSIAGFIIVPVITQNVAENFRLYKQLSDSRIPFVFCNRGVEGVDAPVVTSNSYYGGYIAAKHLIENGYRRIAFVSKIKYSTSIERCYGYASALIEAGLSVQDDLIVMKCKPTDGPACYGEIRELLSREDRPDAIFCFNDAIAWTACRVIQELGLRVSSDVGIIGYDNVDICGVADPPITSVSYRNIEIGEKAAHILRSMMLHQPVSQFTYSLFQPEIVRRGSCRGPGVPAV